MMNESPPNITSVASLEQLLLRDDLWLGDSQRFAKGAAVDTGYDALNDGLLYRGWPLGQLIEVCEQGIQGEWLLFTPALLAVDGLIVLLNPPAAPFSQALIQAGIDLERLLVVNPITKQEFIACFSELSRADVGAVLAWQPNEAMTYTELRKCQLAASEGTGLSVIFRPAAAQQQSSPATLRVYAQLTHEGLSLTLFKQKGYLSTHQPKPVVIEVPDSWKPVLPYHALDQKELPRKSASSHKQLASVTPLVVTPLRGKR